MPRDVKQIKIDWTGNDSQVIQCSDFRNIGITVVGTGDLSVLGSKQKDIIDVSQASTIDNAYRIITIADEGTPQTYVNTASVTGSTFIGEVNTNLLTWIVLRRTAADVDAFVTITSNQ
jgi:hypothetical protein